MRQSSPYTFKEEVANSVTHGVGILISIVALSIMVLFSSTYGNIIHVVSSAIFGSTMVLLYTASTLYHTFQKPRIKHIFKIIDHSCIYALIAGTYTPFVLVTLRGILGWSIFAVVWFLTAVGIIFKIFFINRFKMISTIAYILMGWIIVVAIKPLLEALPENAIAWLVTGGIIYTIGTIFYAWKKSLLTTQSGTYLFCWELFVISAR